MFQAPYNTVTVSIIWFNCDFSLFQAPYNTVTVSVITPSAGFAADIFELAATGTNNGQIRIKNANLLQNDDSEEYVVRCQNVIKLLLHIQ